MASFDLTGLNASATTEYAKTQSQNAYAENLKTRLQSITAGAKSSKTDSTGRNEELWEACKSFESYFTERIFKEMDKSVKLFSDEEEDQSTSTLVNYFKDQAFQDISSTATNQTNESGSNSLAQMLYENMSRNLGIDASELNAKSADSTATSAETDVAQS